jgi:hypothetical protein
MGRFLTPDPLNGIESGRIVRVDWIICHIRIAIQASRIGQPTQSVEKLVWPIWFLTPSIALCAVSKGVSGGGEGSVPPPIPRSALQSDPVFARNKRV